MEAARNREARGEAAREAPVRKPRSLVVKLLALVVSLTLVAELGSAYLCADLAIGLSEREDHASYIASWVAALKNDKRAIFHAAAQAERAAAWLHARQPSVCESGPEPADGGGAAPRHRGLTHRALGQLR